MLCQVLMVCACVSRARYLWNLSVLLHRFSLFTRNCQTRRGAAIERPVDKEGGVGKGRMGVRGGGGEWEVMEDPKLHW